jgi:hypothetical protein
MSLKENALQKLIDYRRAHLAMKAAPDGKKSQAIRLRDKAHSDLILASELYERTVKKEPER